MIRLLVVLSLLALGTAGAQIPQSEYAARRAALAARMPDGVLVVLGAHEPTQDYMSFYQSSPFTYLTGYDEPEATLVFAKKGGQVATTLFVEARDPAREVWSGARHGVEGAKALTGIDARVNEQLPSALDSLLAGATRIAVVGSGAEGEDASAIQEARLVRELKAKHPQIQIADATSLVMMLRGKKSAGELALIKQAVAITVDAQREAAKLVEPGTNEFEAQALIEYTFRRDGADRPSFASIVGSGPNSTALHYSKDDRFMAAGDVVVMDIGASFRGYAADVTRTYPVSGTFTPAQREIYQLVRDAQAAAERQAKLGAHAQLMSDSSNAVLATGLAKLGLIESPAATYDCGPGANAASQQCAQLSLYYMHGIGHGIGLDVHDPDQFYFTGTIAPGSAFTIEPGVYVRGNLLEIIPKTARNAQLVAKIKSAVDKYANVGIRIEDDYIATNDGVEWISRAPRELDEVEALMKEPYTGPAPRDATKIEAFRKTEGRKD